MAENIIPCPTRYVHDYINKINPIAKHLAPVTYESAMDTGCTDQPPSADKPRALRAWLYVGIGYALNSVSDGNRDNWTEDQALRAYIPAHLINDWVRETFRKGIDRYRFSEPGLELAKLQDRGYSVVQVGPAMYKAFNLYGDGDYLIHIEPGDRYWVEAI